MLMSIDSDEPRDARTHFTLERRLPTAALLCVVLDTGRTHQIRVHLAGDRTSRHPATPSTAPLTSASVCGASSSTPTRLAFTHPGHRRAEIDITIPAARQISPPPSSRPEPRRPDPEP